MVTVNNANIKFNINLKICKKINILFSKIAITF